MEMKPKEPQGFFSDRKVWISILALMVAIGSLTWSYLNQKEQNRRWEILNTPNPHLKEVALSSFKELTLDEVEGIKWGYNQDFYVKNGTANVVVLYHILIANDSLNQQIKSIKPVFTIPDILKELERIKFKGNSASILKKYRPIITIENMGKTEAKKLSINIEAKLPDADWQNVFSDKAEINLPVSQSTSVFFDFTVPVLNKLPEKIGCRIILKYQDVKNKIINKVIEVKWESKDNRWTYES